MFDRSRVVSTVLGLVGAAAGGALGFWAFGWALNQGFYALVLPGGLLGLGCSLLARHPSTPRGIVCGVAGLALGLFTEWWHAPFKDDSRFSYFLAHVPNLQGLTLLMLLVGTLAAFWLGKDAALGRSVASPRG
jgi:hypothetical protein